MLRARRRKRPQAEIQKKFWVNERIRSRDVLVIDETGQTLGAMPIAKALAITREKELDLVEVEPKANPPVCKILDYGQFQYQQNRRAQQQKAHAKKIETKCIRISYKIGLHDLEFRKNQAIKFLGKGDKVKVETILRGRERQYTRLAVEKMENFIKSLGENISLEQPIKKLGNQISALINPTK